MYAGTNMHVCVYIYYACMYACMLSLDDNNFHFLADIYGYCGVSRCTRRHARQHRITGILITFAYKAIIELK